MNSDGKDSSEEVGVEQVNSVETSDYISEDPYCRYCRRRLAGCERCLFPGAYDD